MIDASNEFSKQTNPKPQFDGWVVVKDWSSWQTHPHHRVLESPNFPFYSFLAFSWFLSCYLQRKIAHIFEHFEFDKNS